MNKFQRIYLKTICFQFGNNKAMQSKALDNSVSNGPKTPPESTTLIHFSIITYRKKTALTQHWKSIFKIV